MSLLPWVGLVAGFGGIAYVLTGVVRGYALRRGMLDQPNERSSHANATPRGGGLAVVAVVTCTALVLGLRGTLAPAPTIAWCVGGALIAAVGFVDDRRGLSPLARLLAHFAAAVLLLVAAGGLAPLPWPGGPIDLGLIGLVLAVAAVIWSINLFNFMDGIDGIAASQSAFVTGGATLLVIWHGIPGVQALMAAVVCAASLGFLAWNWPPARIFMGDVGSGFLGFAIAVCAVLSLEDGPLTLWTWLVLHGLFLADATTTLLVRLARGERVYQAHRLHAYQRLSRRWGSHRAVTLLCWAINLGWLLPLAALTVAHRNAGVVVAAIALLPLFAGAGILGAGRAEQ